MQKSIEIENIFFINGKSFKFASRFGRIIVSLLDLSGIGNRY